AIVRRHWPARADRRADRIVGGRAGIDAERCTRARHRVRSRAALREPRWARRELRLRPVVPGRRLRQQLATRQRCAGVSAASGVRVLMRSVLLLLAACGTNQTPQPEPMPVLPDCIPNRDGVITAAELPVAIGATLTYYTGTNRTIDQALHDGAWGF